MLKSVGLGIKVEARIRGLVGPNLKPPSFADPINVIYLALSSGPVDGMGTNQKE